MFRGTDKGRLTDEEYDELSESLKNLTMSRDSICNVMGFALDCSEAAVDIVDVIMTSMLSPETKLQHRLAHLYLISDILHNSTAPVQNASLYRTKFQEALPVILHSFQLSHSSMGGRMSANQLKEKVVSVLSAWETWSIFPPMYMIGLHVTFDSPQGPELTTSLKNVTVSLEVLRRKAKQAGLVTTGSREELMMSLMALNQVMTKHVIALVKKGSENAVEMEAASILLHDSLVEWGIVEPKKVQEILEDKTEDSCGGVEDDDIDGEPYLEDDIDGEPMDEDIDGEPMEDGDIDGEPFEEDIDGEPIDDEPLV